MKTIVSDIHDFKQLFFHEEQEDGKNIGIPHGSSLLLSGPPGAGKTTFALAFARSMMIKRRRDNKQNDKHEKKYVLYYISPEVSRELLEINYREFGWFEKSNYGIAGGIEIWLGPKSPQNGSGREERPDFVSITSYPEMDRPVPSPDDQVNHIFNRIARSITPTEGMSDDQVEYIVVVDSITALLKGCVTPGDERRQTHEILHRFTTTFGKGKLALIIMTAEQDLPDDPENRVSLIEDYLARIVIRLAHKPLPLGRTSRTMEVVKSQGVHMVPGIHTWDIITADRHEHHFRTTELQAEVRAHALGLDPKDPEKAGKDAPAEPDNKSVAKWGTIAFFARPRILHRTSKHSPDKRGEGSDYLSTGIPGLDEILMGNQEYWLRSKGVGRDGSKSAPALGRGKTTLLAGTVGTGTTKLSLQFLLHDVRSAIKQVTFWDLTSACLAEPVEAVLETAKKAGKLPPALIDACKNAEDAIVKANKDVNTVLETENATWAIPEIAKKAVEIGLDTAKAEIEKVKLVAINEKAEDVLKAAIYTLTAIEAARTVWKAVCKCFDNNKEVIDSIIYDKDLVDARAIVIQTALRQRFRHRFDQRRNPNVQNNICDAPIPIAPATNNPKSLLIFLNVKAETIGRETWKIMLDGLRKEDAIQKRQENQVQLYPSRTDTALFIDALIHFEGSDEVRRQYLRVLDFTQSNFEFDHLISHLNWAINKFQPERIAFDGLSEYLIRTDEVNAPKMLEAINSLIAHHPAYSQAKEHITKPPVVMMTYELTMEGDPLAPQSLGVSADNIIAVKQVSLQDEIHKVIYVLKSEHGGVDQNVRELDSNADTNQFRVRSGLDTFNGLLSGKIEQAEVLLQLFGENEAEKYFNQWLVQRLMRLATLKFTVLDFSRSVIGRTLEDTGSQTLFPPADLKVVSVDEWWLSHELEEADNDRERKGIQQPLLDLNRMWDAREDFDTLAPSWQDFWYFELDKASPLPDKASPLPDNPNSPAKPRYFAVPGYMDYGLFCVNVRHMLKTTVEDERFGVQGFLNAYQQSVAKVDKEARVITLEGADRSRSELDRKRCFDSLIEQRKQMITVVPKHWVKMTTDSKWFVTKVEGNEEEETIVTLLKAIEGQAGAGGAPLWGFSFDIGTRENCVSFFFELAWAFGASERCLGPDALGNIDNNNREAIMTAFKFLQFLVLEDIMPHRATVETARHSVFSRHFYSTLQSVVDMERADTPGRAKDPQNKPKHNGKDIDRASLPKPACYIQPPLIALPWFPGGAVGSQNPTATEYTARASEIYKRCYNLWNRCCDAGFTRRPLVQGEGETAIEKLDAIPTDLADVLEKSKVLMEILQIRSEDNMHGNKANERAATHADLYMMARQHLTRLALFLPSNRSRVEIASVDDPMVKPLPKDLNSGPSHPAGYCCSGSWLYGIHRSTRSPSLARDLLQEITSLDAAEERARRGAGIPARSDFFELHGNERVPGMEYVTWNQLVTQCGATVRRRGRVTSSTVKPARVHQVIYREILDALQRAYLRKAQYNEGEKTREDVITGVHTESDYAVIRMLKEASP